MITRLLTALASRSRALRLRRLGCRIEGAVWLRAVEVPRQARRIVLQDGAALDIGVTLVVSGAEEQPPAIQIGRRTYINRHTIIDASESITIGDDCMIGPFCYLTDHDHTSDHAGRPAGGSLRSAPVVLQPRCWIGAHVSILKGVTIGTGAVVGAGSVVTRDVAPGTVVAGNPARPIHPATPA